MTQAAYQSVACFHCGLDIPDDCSYKSELAGKWRQFCCLGCQSVCNAIFTVGLQGYYQRTPEGVLLAPPPPPPKDLEAYDIEEVQQEFTVSQGKFRDIHLLVEGIHCAACVWLIERAMLRIPGVDSAYVNLASKRLRLRWDNQRINLSSLLSALGKIGYSATPYDPDSAEGAMRRANRSLLFRLFFAGFTMMNMMWISIAMYSGASDGEFRNFFHILGFALATPTLLYSGYPFYRGALGGLRAGRLTMDLPIALGLTVTYFYSLYVTLSGSKVGEVYFDTVTNLIFVILVGRYLEGMFRHQAVSATNRLMELQPRVAIVLHGEKEEITPIRGVKAGERVLVKPGYKVPVDGVVVHGHSAVDESMLSGESIPVNKSVSDKVAAGTLNGSGAIIVEVVATLQDTVLAKIIRLVEEAQSSKAPIQRLSDTIVPWFVLATLLFSFTTFLWWSPLSAEIAFMAATSVLIITCPCALGMATPMSIAVASGLAAQHGILVKNGLVLETLSKVTHFVFDKTGTLTEGKMRVSQVLTSDNVQMEAVMSFAAAVERYAEHGVAMAIVQEADQQKIRYRNLDVSEFQVVPGMGVSARISGLPIFLGSAKWLLHNQIELDAQLCARSAALEQQVMTSVHCAIAGKHVAVLILADKLRADARAMVDALRAQGIGMTLLSGDRRAVAEAVATQLGGMDVIAEVLPQDKDRVIQQLQQRGEIVAMVGDGINDAPALIRADVGIALGSGTDVSVESADIVLMHNELDKVRLAVLLSRHTLRTIKQNIGISLVYNMIMVPLAMMAKITPLVAAITMPISSLVVIGNAARIRKLFKSTDR